ncbi:polynucleotide 5'-hydroxyl-kinase NOL9-like [Lotus japonicus]|uniref:polynucleotide 5'-hydroxyl-kinase NOL9-like n=1 Tax=Lotus japonicus TaxID=34305 RepID=UPI002589B168|nr:polynucleotide 5'-hydroxyl-kinase NOL9-like [Lotus japonicus]XP_057443034.1 polynucleotide 5'-hydroxyl-kinase NOL9-like [Lotus japonicus]XP_057443035.1 polynucleotide 5'-hydroxyl-kinase NOL9-like [Lotus japonicus]
MGSSPSPDIYIPEQWSEAAGSIADSSTPPITLICGAKNCGKTIFSRYLLNVLLHRYSRVAYLDTDVGQPEFTAPAFLSLTIVHQETPDITIPCLKTPERCLFFGDVSSKRDPTSYLNYVFAIYDYYRKEYCSLDKEENSPMIDLPLIVNTPGWVKGVGYSVLVDMLKYICPTHVVKISISSENKNLPAGQFWLDGEHNGTINLIEINSARQDSLNRSVLVQKDARLLRDLRIMAYFRQCFPSDSDISTIKELAHSLASHCPYEVPIASIKIQHLHREVPSSEMFYSLNASIVGLAVDSEGPENLPWCLGLGIVRGIDTIKGVLYVITPVPHSSLDKVNLLLQGYIQIPICLLQVQGCISPYMSADVLTTS